MSSNFRPVYHFSPESGWLNDPNGLVYHGGLWHLFYQHIPTQTHWGLMHWGHAVSRDLTLWEHWPIALYPDSLGTIFSGSAAVKSDEELVACFTHASKERQVQSLAFSSDGGRTWEKYENNPVLTFHRHDFRDPKIFRHNDEWFMVVAAGVEVQIYSSPDLIAWTYLSSFASPQSNWVWECPELFELNGRWVLVASFVKTDITSDDSQGCYYWIGDFDGTRFTPTTNIQPLSFGPDDYATVSWSDAPENRRIVIGWMSNWPYAAKTPTADEGWRGAMTLPRELALKNDILVQTPPQEILKRRSEKIGFDEKGIEFRGDAYELEAEIDISQLQGNRVGFRLRVGEGEATSIFYDREQKAIVIDRSQSGQVDFHPSFAAQFIAPLKLETEILELRVFVDRCSVEVFVQEGMLYGAMLIFPSLESQGIEFVGEGARIVCGAIYPYKI